MATLRKYSIIELKKMMQEHFAAEIIDIAQLHQRLILDSENQINWILNVEHDWYENSDVIDRFFSFDSEVSASAYKEYDYYLQNKRFLIHALPIANCISDNKICVDLRPETFGQILYWDHEYELDADQDNPDYPFFFIAKNYFQFKEKIIKEAN